MAENQSKETTYSKLNSMLNFDGTANKMVEPEKPRRVIIRANSPDEIRRKSLEIQQQDAIQKKFYKTVDHGFQKAMQYEAARLPAYLDYEGMEYYPLIASALDLFMEEATTIGENGKMLNIYSEKSRIKLHLEELFYDIINVNVNLPFWARNLCKYGDNFVYLLGEKKRGITVAKQMVNYEMERIERIRKGKAEVKFRQKQTDDEFNIFEIAHFRLLGDDKYLPYGSSVLNKIRRVFRQLIMAEDAMLTYRIVRAGEKRVFKIDVGNIDDDDMEAYMNKIAARFKKQQQVAGNGQIDYRFNILGNDEDYFIPVRNANVQTGIDTLQGAQNLDQIQDIEYLRDNLFTGLGIPKPFLGFQEAAGDGKNMAQMDVRFAKKINRIQQAIIQELNKMAIIHLHLLGFEGDDLSDFSLSLTNPSTQMDMLKTELLTNKATVYQQLTQSDGGMAALSHTEAKKRILGMSDQEIIDDLRMQRMERAVAQELQDSPLVIRETGIFTDIDKKYGTDEPQAGVGAEQGQEGDMGMGADAGAGGINPPVDAGMDSAAPQSPADLPPQGASEGKKSKKPLIMTEDQYRKYGDRFDDFIKNMIVGDKVNQIAKESYSKKVINETSEKAEKLNEKAEQYAKEIDKFLGDDGNLNTSDDIDIYSIEINENDKRVSNKKKSDSK